MDLVGKRVRVGFALLEVVGGNAGPHDGGNGTVTRSMPLQGSGIYRVDFSDGGYAWYGADQLEPIEVLDASNPSA